LRGEPARAALDRGALQRRRRRNRIADRPAARARRDRHERPRGGRAHHGGAALGLEGRLAPRGGRDRRVLRQVRRAAAGGDGAAAPGAGRAARLTRARGGRRGGRSAPARREIERRVATATESIPRSPPAIPTPVPRPTTEWGGLPVDELLKGDPSLGPAVRTSPPLPRRRPLRPP